MLHTYMVLQRPNKSESFESEPGMFVLYWILFIYVYRAANIWIQENLLKAIFFTYVILSFCYRFSCVFISISKYLPMCTKFGIHIPQCTTSGFFLSFTVFIDFFSYLGLSLFLRWNSDHFQIEFLWVKGGKWTILKLFHQMVCCAHRVLTECLHHADRQPGRCQAQSW